MLERAAGVPSIIAARKANASPAIQDGGVGAREAGDPLLLAAATTAGSLTTPGLYHYFHSRAELLTALIIDA
jgi:hypothetical protein